MGFFKRLFGLEPEEVFIPENDLERVLLAVREGAAPIDDLLRRLVASKVFVLSKGNPEAVIAGGPMQPLVVLTSHGFHAVALFSAPSRSTEASRHHAEFATGLHLDFQWVLDNCPQGAGLVLNPATVDALELPPEKVAVFREEVARGDFR